MRWRCLLGHRWKKVKTVRGRLKCCETLGKNAVVIVEKCERCERLKARAFTFDEVIDLNGEYIAYMLNGDRDD